MALDWLWDAWNVEGQEAMTEKSADSGIRYEEAAVDDDDGWWMDQMPFNAYYTFTKYDNKLLYITFSHGC